MTYYIHFIEKNKIVSTNKYENEEDYGSTVADWFGCGYIGREMGNVTYIHTDRNVEDVTEDY